MYIHLVGIAFLIDLISLTTKETLYRYVMFHSLPDCSNPETTVTFVSYDLFLCFVAMSVASLKNEQNQLLRDSN